MYQVEELSKFRRVFSEKVSPEIFICDEGLVAGRDEGGHRDLV